MYSNGFEGYFRKIPVPQFMFRHQKIHVVTYAEVALIHYVDFYNFIFCNARLLPNHMLIARPNRNVFNNL